VNKRDAFSRTKSFYEAHLPFDTKRFVNGGWQSAIDGCAEFCFERDVKGKPEYVCIVLDEKILTGSEEALESRLMATLKPSFRGFLPCRADYSGTRAKHGGRERRYSPRKGPMSR